jgi:thiosulfate/3-mercaptopyruvate sulfurtransferase
MTLKTLGLAPVLLLLGAPTLAAQGSPLQWPVPPPGPRREVVFPRLLIGAAELARALSAAGPQPAAGASSSPTIPTIPVDARGAGPFTAGHLPGAVPAGSALAEAGTDATGAGSLDRLRTRLAALGISGRETVVIYGDADREAIAHLYRLLRWAGCAEVLILDGGLAAWRAAGEGVETGGGGRPPTAGFRPVSRQETVVGAPWVADRFGLAGVELLDVRDARGWERWETPPTFAAGHIPASLPFDPRALLPAGEGWPEPAGLRRRLAAVGPRAGDPVPLGSTFVLSGEGPRDPRPDLGLLLLTLAGLEARVFPGGWQEWTAVAHPIVRVVAAAEVAALLRRESPGLAADRRPRGVILIDLREPRDFAIGHLPGALNLPILRFPADFEPLVAADWPQADRTTFPLLLYCYGVDCVRSRQAGAEAARRGFRNVLWFRGGVQEWRDGAYPLFESPLLDSRSSTRRLRLRHPLRPDVQAHVLDLDLRAVFERQDVRDAERAVAVPVLPAAGEVGLARAWLDLHPALPLEAGGRLALGFEDGAGREVIAGARPGDDVRFAVELQRGAGGDRRRVLHVHHVAIRAVEILAVEHRGGIGPGLQGDLLGPPGRHDRKDADSGEDGGAKESHCNFLSELLFV